MKLSTVRGVSKDIYSMSRIVLSRNFNRLANVCPADQSETIAEEVSAPKDMAADIQETIVAAAVDDTPASPRL